jgi:hypothetical protein
LHSSYRRFSPAVILGFIGFPLALLFLVVLARDLSFFYDEWEFILNRPLTLNGLLTPWYGHLSILPILLWRVLMGLFGTGSYWPFLLAAWVAHGAVVTAVYLIAREHMPDTWAVGAALVMAVLGSGWENILWAFQVAMMGATALGLLALWISPRRPVLAAMLLTAAVMCHGVGLAFLAGTALHLLLARPRATLWLLLPASLWGVWYVAYGTAAPSPDVEALPGFIGVGIGYAVAGVLGTQPLVVGAVAMAAFAALRPRLSADQWALLASVLIFITMAGLVRSGAGPQAPTQSRYVYVVAPAVLVVGAAAISRLSFARYLGIALLTFALIGNVGLMVHGHGDRLSRERCEEAHIPAAERMIPAGLRAYPCF